MPRVLLHTCCAPCASHATEELRRQGHEVTLCFSNANLAPAAEYFRRLEAAQQLSVRTGTPLLEDPPDHAAWLSVMRGTEEDAEGCARCGRCFQYSLDRVQSLAAQHGFDAFTTSLTISPHKNSARILAIGRELDPLRFLPVDFKKGGGFQRSVELARLYQLYRQDYCGCEYSAAARMKV
jgi:predicted adenine nucleotide alpha hydrolase (AANH) superfamily ATPase